MEVAILIERLYDRGNKWEGGKEKIPTNCANKSDLASGNLLQDEDKQLDQPAVPFGVMSKMSAAFWWK